MLIYSRLREAFLCFFLAHGHISSDSSRFPPSECSAPHVISGRRLPKTNRDQLLVTVNCHICHGFFAFEATVSIISQRRNTLLNIAYHRELKSLPLALHWFCPTFLDDSVHTSADGGLPRGQQNRLVDDVDRRRQIAIDCLQLFGYNGEDAIPHQEYLVKAFDRQLGKCDACITEYYKAKRRMVDRLRHEYNEEEVDLLVALFDKQDFRRIERGLDNASQTLQAVDISQRSRSALDDASQFALFEAMNCDAFLQDEALVRNHLDTPLELAQTNRRLRVPQYVPAATYFIFDAHPSRCSWAMQTWAKMRKGLSKDDFDFAVRDPLARQLKMLTESFPDALVIQRFWCGMQLIVEKLDKELVAHSLLALEIDVCRLSLDHLQSPTPALRFLLQTIQGLLEIAPKNFWDSMGTISPTVVIEQIFNNPQYDKYMIEAQADTDSAPSPLKDMLSWTDAFMASLQPSHQVQACRSLAFQLIDRLQGDRFAAHARLACKRTGLCVLSRTLASSNTSDAWLTQVGRMVAAESLEVASIYIQRIVATASLPRRDPSYGQLQKPAMETIQTALALECKSVRMDYETIKLKKEPPSGFCSYTSSTMDAVVRGLDSSNPALARAALIGVNDLMGLEKFKIDAEAGSTETQKFNAALGHLAKVVCEILERINDFRPTDLDELFGHFETAAALVASLFSPDASTYNAGLDLIKTISSEVGRREAMGHLLQSFFDTTLNSISWAIQRISHNKTYASCPRMLKTLDDTLNVLCDSQSGLLRTRTLVSVPERNAVRKFWACQWNALRVIYEMTEEWGRLRVSDTDTLKKFCRDTMQLSDRLFDQYSVFANAFTNVKQEGTEVDVEKPTGEQELLSHPALTMQSMVKWLRLRDPYMAQTSASLTQKVLDRMSDAKMKLGENPVQYLERVLKGSSEGKTILTPAQKAEIARALERNLDRPIALADHDQERSDSSKAASEAPQLAMTRRQKQGIDFDKWTSNARLDMGSISDVEDDNPVPLEGLRAYKASDMANTIRASSAISNRAHPGVINVKEASRKQATSLFKEKREKEIQAKKIRDAEMSAKAKQRSNNAAPAGVSVLKGLGVEGKDHAPGGPGIMVSSDSESDSQEEANDELFGPLPKVSDAVRDYQLSRLKAKEHQGPVKKARQVRSAKDMRARLAPDLTGLHRILLGWEYFHTGDFPPGTSRKDYSQVPSRFRTPMDYHQVFEPLLILEAWNGFLKSREEISIKAFAIKVANRMTVDSFIEISTTMPMAEGQELGIAEADIILLSKGNSPTTESAEPHCLARVHRIIRKKAAMEISYRVNPGNGLMSAMAPNSTIHGARILSITPLEREYGALSGLKYFDLCDEVIQAKPSPLLQYTDQQLGPLIKNYEVNRAQAKAIRSALDNDAFTLVQG